MSTYTNNIPQASQTIAETQPTIQGNFAYLNSCVAQDHNFTGNSATAQDGNHTVIKFVTQGGDPGAAAYTRLYTKTVDARTELYMKDSSNNLTQLTGFRPNNKSYAWLNGLLMQWGQVTLNIGGGGYSSQDSSLINFPTPFPVSCQSMTATIQGNFTTGSYTGPTSVTNLNKATCSVIVVSYTISQFTLRYIGFLPSPAIPININYIAIGY